MKKPLKILLAVTVLASFLLFQNFSLQKEEYALLLSRLPESVQGLRVVHISDLHGRSFGENNARLLRKIQKAQPHIICITGDLFDENTDFSALAPFLRELPRLAPTFYVTGNHEWQVAERKNYLRYMEALGIEVLENEHVLWAEDFVIAGVHDPCGPYDQKTPAELMAEIRREAGNDAFVLMLCHRNDGLKLWSELGADLVLSGHCHGGVVRLPFLGGVFASERKFFPEFDSGLYGQEQTLLYVSRGLGYSNVPFRLLNRPQVSLLLLNRK